MVRKIRPQFRSYAAKLRKTRFSLHYANSYGHSLSGNKNFSRHTSAFKKRSVEVLFAYFHRKRQKPLIYYFKCTNFKEHDIYAKKTCYLSSKKAEFMRLGKFITKYLNFKYYGLILIYCPQKILLLRRVFSFLSPMNFN